MTGAADDPHAPEDSFPPTAAHRPAPSRSRTTAAQTARVKAEGQAAAAQAAAAKRTAARTGAARTAAARASAEKAALAKAEATAESAKQAAARVAAVRAGTERTSKAPSKRSPAAKSTTAKATAAKTTAAKTTAAKTAAAKTAAAKTAAAKSTTAKGTAAKSTTAKAPTTKTPAAQAPAAAKAAAAATSSARKAPARTAAHAPAAPVAEVVKPASPTEPAIEAEVPETATETMIEILSPEAVGAGHDSPVDSVPGVAALTTASAPDAREAETSGAQPDSAPSPRAPERGAAAPSEGQALVVRGLVKRFGGSVALGGIDLTVPAGTFYGIVGPNGAGKTTTLSIIAGLLRADAGTVRISGIDQKTDPAAAKKVLGVLPDRLRTFDRLTGRQLLHYYGLLRGLKADVVERRVADLARAFDLTGALSRVVSDYSAGMTKKLMLAGAMIHSPRVLVLDEPFESVDPVSSGVILDILRAYVAHGGTVVLSSHGMDLVQRVCERVAIIVGGEVLAEGTVDEVRAGQTLEQRFVELSGTVSEVEGLEWLHTFSD
ncbi:MAG: ABC transporter ATP-binding protein [Actinobacteria bacterium]|nr:ABC transporter ATP-binding protein [Actinomycetota bacterium]